MNSTLRCLAKSATAKPTLDGKVPIRNDAPRIAGVAVVVAAYDLDLAAEHAARRVDLLDGQLPALLVRFEESREDLVAVELTELDRCLRVGRPDQGKRDQG